MKKIKQKSQKIKNSALKGVKTDKRTSSNKHSNRPNKTAHKQSDEVVFSGKPIKK